jgi:hypothetical protein
MNVCDLCSVPIGSNERRFSADHIRKAVRIGLRPNSTSVELGAAFGMSKEDTELAWIHQVMSDNTDWLLCSACSGRCEQYVPLKKWWQFWK